MSIHTSKNSFSRLTDVRVLCNVLFCAKINRDKAAGKWDQYRGYGDDRDPTFKLVL